MLWGWGITEIVFRVEACPMLLQRIVSVPGTGELDEIQQTDGIIRSELARNQSPAEVTQTGRTQTPTTEPSENYEAKNQGQSGL